MAIASRKIKQQWDHDIYLFSLTRLFWHWEKRIKEAEMWSFFKSLQVFVLVCLLAHSVVSDSAAPWTVAHRLLCPYNFSGKNTGGSCHFFLQWIFLIQGSKPCLLYLLHWQVGSLSLAPPGKLWALLIFSDSQFQYSIMMHTYCEF